MCTHARKNLHYEHIHLHVYKNHTHIHVHIRTRTHARTHTRGLADTVCALRAVTHGYLINPRRRWPALTNSRLKIEKHDSLYPSHPPPPPCTALNRSALFTDSMNVREGAEFRLLSLMSVCQQKLRVVVVVVAAVCRVVGCRVACADSGHTNSYLSLSHATLS